MYDSFFNIGGKIVCINFGRRTMRLLDKIDLSGIRKIHVYVFNVKNTDMEVLSKLSPVCRKNRIPCIIHCYGTRDIGFLKKRASGVKKDRYFHFNNAVGHNHVYRRSADCTVTVSEKQVKMSKVNYNHGMAYETVKSVSYNYDADGNEVMMVWTKNEDGE